MLPRLEKLDEATPTVTRSDAQGVAGDPGDSPQTVLYVPPKTPSSAAVAADPAAALRRAESCFRTFRTDLICPQDRDLRCHRESHLRCHIAAPATDMCTLQLLRRHPNAGSTGNHTHMEMQAQELLRGFGTWIRCRKLLRRRVLLVSPSSSDRWDLVGRSGPLPPTRLLQ